MKIVCNKYELAALVRSCLSAEMLDNCSGCFFKDMCSTGNSLEENGIREYEISSIEDICEVREDG